MNIPPTHDKKSCIYNKGCGVPIAEVWLAVDKRWLRAGKRPGCEQLNGIETKTVNR
jgi:hypothetical protein